MNFLKRFSLPYYVWVIIVGTFLSRFGTSMVLPYVSLLLVHNKGLPLYWAGIAISSSYLAQTISGFIGGYFSTKFDRFKTLKVTILFYAFLFFCMGAACQWLTNKFWVGSIFVLCWFLAGGCRSLIETVGQIVISYFTPIPQKHLAFSLRYTFINIGVSIGPLVALAVGVLTKNLAFWLTGICVFSYFVLLQMTVKNETLTTEKNNFPSFLTSMHTLVKDKQFLYFTCAAILTFVGLNQMETLFAYISYTNTGSTNVFAVMYCINAVTVVTLQMQMIQFTKKFNIHNVITCGIALITLGLIGVGFSGSHPFYYYLSGFIFTLGEILSFALVGLYIDLLAPSSHKEAYFGINTFVLCGIIFSSPLITWISYEFGVTTGIILAAVLTSVGIPLILAAKKVSESTQAQLATTKEIAA